MPKTLTHQINYPDGNSVPNVPVAMQALAESTDQALARVSEAPFIVCGKTAAQPGPAAANTLFTVTWDMETWKQGIGHKVDQDTDQFVIQESGLYTVNAKVAWGNPDVTAAVLINVNGTDLPRSRQDVSGTFGAWPKPTTIFDLKLAAGDVLRVRTTGSKGGVGLSSSECFFSLRKSAGYTQQGAK